MFSDKYIDREIERLKTGSKGHIYAFAVSMFAIVFINFLDNDQSINSVTIYLIIIILLGIYFEIQKMKIVKKLVSEDKEK